MTSIYLFDLRDLDKALEEQSAKTPALAAAAPIPDGDWESLAGARDQRSRQKLEDEVFKLSQESELSSALHAITKRGDAGSAAALRILLAKEPPISEASLNELEKTASALGATESLGEIARERLSSAGDLPGSPGLGEDKRFLGLLAATEGKKAAIRSSLLARFVLMEKSDREAVRRALAYVVTNEELKNIEAAIENEGGPVSLLPLLNLSKEAHAANKPAAAANPGDALPPLPDLEQELEEADAALSKTPKDVQAIARLGLASLRLARARMESGGKNVSLLLEDANQLLAKAGEAQPENLSIGIERARVAYLLGHYEEEEKLGQEIYRRAAANSDTAVEALRWVGDACARLLPNRSGKDPTLEATGIVRGMRALADVCASAESAEIDWISLASFLHALDLTREELCIWLAGASRIPDSNRLRNGLNGALWQLGRIDLAPRKAEWIAEQYPRSGACAWHYGYAWMLSAEEHRRASRVQEAIADYSRAEGSFHRAIALDAATEASSTHFLGMCALGKGFSHLIEGKQPEAADAFVDGLAIAPSAGDARDGLDREAVDLLDGALEWREGRASPVDYMTLSEKFERSGLAARWFLALSDTGLREGLRADGRSDRNVSQPDAQSRRREARTRIPNEEGDRYLEASIAAARKAFKLQEDDAAKHALAQSLTVHAERLLIRDRVEESRPLLAEAANLLNAEAPEGNANTEKLLKAAAALRASLGPARPIVRPGR